MLAIVENVCINTYIQFMVNGQTEGRRKRTIRQRGDKFYAYEITSVMENGKKKTVSKYLGRVDPESGKLLEKIPEKSAENRRKIARTIQTLKDIRVADYGGTYLLDRIQRKIKPGEDFDTCFGTTSETMLTLAFALVQCGGVFSAVEGTLEKTWSKELYDIAGVYDSGTLSKYTHSIGVTGEHREVLRVQDQKEQRPARLGYDHHRMPFRYGWNGRVCEIQQG